MNILFHSWAFPPNGGGVGVYISHMAEALSHNGHRVFIVTGSARGRAAEEKRGNVTIFRRYDRADIGRPWVCEEVLNLCEKFSVDIIEGQDYLGDCQALLKKKSRPPVVIKVHSCNALKVLYVSQILYWWQRVMIRAALLRQHATTRRERYCIEHADMLLAPSKRIFDEMEKQGLKLPEKRSVVPNPIGLNRISFDREAPVPTVLFVGRKDFGKGIQYLPGIVRALAAHFPDFLMQIVGPDSYARGVGSLQGWLEKKMGTLINNVRFHGSIPGHQLVKFYQRAWVVILPSRWDTFPTVLLEAMSWGKPVVASPHGGMPEMLTGTLCRTAPPDSEKFITLIRNFLESKRLRKIAGCSLYAKAWRAYRAELVAKCYLDATGRLSRHFTH